MEVTEWTSGAKHGSWSGITMGTASQGTEGAHGAGLNCGESLYWTGLLYLMIEKKKEENGIVGHLAVTPNTVCNHTHLQILSCAPQMLDPLELPSLCKPNLFTSKSPEQVRTCLVSKSNLTLFPSNNAHEDSLVLLKLFFLLKDWFEPVSSLKVTVLSSDKTKFVTWLSWSIIKVGQEILY